MNACLQCLLPIDELRDYMLQEKYQQYNNTKCIDDHQDYLDNMKGFFEDAWKCEARDRVFINPTGLKNMIRKKFFPTM